MKPFVIIVLAAVTMITGWVLYMSAELRAETAPQEIVEPAPIGATPIVIELFTSQSCSSCPPADALAQQLAPRDDLIVISRPVTYWNRIGWEDTFSKQANTDLQRAYARRGLGGRNGVYTPQIVVNGDAGVVGSSSRNVSTLVERAAQRQRPEISVEGNVVHVAGQTQAEVELLIVAVNTAETVAIGSGENRNRTVTYTNIHLAEATLGQWSGGEGSFVLPAILPAAPQADRHAVILRESSANGAGAVLGGRWIS